MSYVIVEDPTETGIPALHIRAMISTRIELEELIAKLNVRLETDFATQGKDHDQRYLDSKPVHPGGAVSAGTRSAAGETGARPEKEDGRTARSFRGD